VTLIESRVSLIQLEGRDCARHGARRFACLMAAAVCLLLAWLCLLTGGIAALASMTGWPWPWLAIAASAIHLLLALVLATTSKAGTTPFPLTRAEFQKDRQWIESLRKNPKSNA
jgi:uncharacterized membrane protein YqjE